jgi:sigma-B regulation protein RsbU (phosphoserine phosphatase)
LFEYSRIINSSLDLNFILNTVLLTVMGKMLVPKGLVLLRRDRGWFEVVAAKGLESNLVGQTIPIQQASRSILIIDRIDKSEKPWVGFFRDRMQKLLIPIVVRNNIVGLLALGERFGSKSFSKLDRQLIESLVELSASAIEKAMMIEQLQVVNRNLDRKYHELNTLFELSKEFNTDLSTDRVLRLLTFSLLGQVGVTRYAICLIEQGTVNIVHSRLEGSVELLKALELCCMLTVPALVSDLARKPKFKAAAEEFAAHGLSAVIPMQVQNQTKGLILLGKRMRGDEYSSTDLEFLYSLANLAIVSMENARLFKEELEKRRLEDELNLARDIQQGLLPRTLPAMNGFEIAAINIPSKQVGGDYYDVVRRSENEYVVAIGDVSGKGIPASLLMANVQAAMRSLAPTIDSISKTTALINDITCSNTSLDRYITFFWGVLDTTSRTFRYVNAGHNQPFLFANDGTVRRLSEGGMILGIMAAQIPYEEGCVHLHAGDVLVLFTDGVSEAMNAEGVDFTEERLESVLKETLHAPAQGIIDQVRRAIDAYVQGTPQSDDITMVVLKAL